MRLRLGVDGQHRRRTRYRRELLNSCACRVEIVRIVVCAPHQRQAGSALRGWNTWPAAEEPGNVQLVDLHRSSLTVRPSAQKMVWRGGGAILNCHQNQTLWPCAEVTGDQWDNPLIRTMRVAGRWRRYASTTATSHHSCEINPIQPNVSARRSGDWSCADGGKILEQAP